jgi:hypothetical protein
MGLTLPGHSIGSDGAYGLICLIDQQAMAYEWRFIRPAQSCERNSSPAEHVTNLSCSSPDLIGSVSSTAAVPLFSVCYKSLCDHSKIAMSSPTNRTCSVSRSSRVPHRSPSWSEAPR